MKGQPLEDGLFRAGDAGGADPHRERFPGSSLGAIVRRTQIPDLCGTAVRQYGSTAARRLARFPLAGRVADVLLNRKGGTVSTTTLIVIVLIVLLLGGGGWGWSRRGR